MNVRNRTNAERSHTAKPEGVPSKAQESPRLPAPELSVGFAKLSSSYFPMPADWLKLMKLAPLENTTVAVDRPQLWKKLSIVVAKIGTSTGAMLLITRHKPWQL